jgi:hypothetical protein
VKKTAPEELLSEGEYKELLRSCAAAGRAVDPEKIKEALVAKWLPLHEENGKEVEKRWKFEEKVRDIQLLLA